jgi:hypothetical protein
MALTILSSINELYRRDVAVDSVDLVTPTHADCLVSGMWVNFHSYGQVEDDTNGTTASPDFTNGLLFQVFTEKGDYSAQALTKVTVLSSFDYVAETDQFNTGATFATGKLLTVNTSGLLDLATTGDMVVAIAYGPASGGLLTYHRCSPFQAKNV